MTVRSRPVEIKTPKSKKSEEKIEEERKTPNSNHAVSSKGSHPKKDDTLQGHENIQPEQTQPIPDHLQHNYKFARICSECYVQNKVSFFISDKVGCVFSMIKNLFLDWF